MTALGIVYTYSESNRQQTRTSTLELKKAFCPMRLYQSLACRGSMQGNAKFVKQLGTVQMARPKNDARVLKYDVLQSMKTIYMEIYAIIIDSRREKVGIV